MGAISFFGKTWKLISAHGLPRFRVLKQFAEDSVGQNQNESHENGLQTHIWFLIQAIDITLR
jgi:hypothetical protein